MGFITKAVCKGSPKHRIDSYTSAVTEPSQAAARMAYLIQLTMTDSKTIFSWLTERPWSQNLLSAQMAVT